MTDQLVVPSMRPVNPHGVRRKEAKSTFSTDGSEIRKFTFPADVDFWNNFVEAVKAVPQSPPLFVVSPSHSDEKQMVNQQYMRGYVREWEEANPHTVTVQTADGEVTFHASSAFWDQVQRMRRAHPGQAGAIQVQSNLDGVPVHTTAEEWNETCNKWEAENGVGRHKGRQLGVQRSPEGTKQRPTAYVRNGVVSFNTTHRERSEQPQHRVPAQAPIPTTFAVPKTQPVNPTFARPAGVPPLPQDQGPGFWAYGVLHYHIHGPSQY
eukprot:TRINITY_DN12318_c0_g1_i4.p1 TRINITY_DN12318_c0_g1~~TRINITY_DN12318_c0_g1_i4.p1  ORF type:complete len:284 (+),score=59.18 TRINITY_DN12318_c0_g1_i4:60-854(+)